MRIKAILFDIDGTLVDSNERHVDAWSEAFESVGSPFERSVIHDQIGKGADMLVPTLLPDADEETRKRATEAHDYIFKSRYLHQVQPFPGARDLLVHVHREGLKPVLASSASQEELDHYLDLLDARDLIAATTSSGDVEHTKPAPDIFATALGKLPGVSPDEAVVVGDTPYDMQAASRCGITPIAVRSGGFPDAVLKQAGARAIHDDVADILANHARALLDA
jgi:membrane protein